MASRTPAAPASTARLRSIRTPRPDRERRALLLAAGGAALLVAGISLYIAMLNPPYLTDESSHVGYVLVLRDGTLPSLDTPVPTGVDPVLDAALSRPWPYSVPEIHIANDPPVFYVAAMPLAALSEEAGITGGPLFGIRAMSVLAGAGAVAMAVLLGRELAGGDTFTGVITGGLVAGLVSVSFVSSLAGLGGPALLATTGVTWALARFARTRTSDDALVVGLWCAGAAAIRPMSLAFALVAGALALVIGVRAHGIRRSRGLLLRLAAPTALLTGWFYALNLRRYGDPTGSAGVFDKYGYEGTRSIWDVLLGPEPFVQTFAYLVRDVYGSRRWWESTGSVEYLLGAGAVVVTATAIVWAFRSRRVRPEEPDRPALVPSAWICAAILGFFPTVLIAQHMSGGGAGHPRYLFPAVPVVAAALALVLVRLDRWIAVAAMTALVGFHLLRMHEAATLYLPPTELFPEEIRTSTVGQPWHGLAVAMALAGAVLLVATAACLARARGRPTVDTAG